MATGAFLLIRAAKAVRENGYLEALEGLWDLPEVVDVEPVSGQYDCVARVEAPIRLIYTVHKVMEKRWIDRVQVLRVDEPVKMALESEKARSARLLRQRAIIHAGRHGLPRPPMLTREPHAGLAEAKSEKERSARLLRQRAIIKARLQERRASVTPVPVG